MMCRESEERERATLKREEKKKQGDPLEEVNILVIVVVDGCEIGCTLNCQTSAIICRAIEFLAIIN